MSDIKDRLNAIRSEYVPGDELTPPENYPPAPPTIEPEPTLWSPEIETLFKVVKPKTFSFDYANKHCHLFWNGDAIFVNVTINTHIISLLVRTSRFNMQKLLHTLEFCNTRNDFGQSELYEDILSVHESSEDW